MIPGSNSTVVVRLKSGEIKLANLLDGKNWFVHGVGFLLADEIDAHVSIPTFPVASGWKDVPNPYDTPDKLPVDVLNPPTSFEGTIRDAGLEEYIDKLDKQAKADTEEFERARTKPEAQPILNYQKWMDFPTMVLGYISVDPEGIGFTVTGEGLLQIIDELRLSGCNRIVVGVYEGHIEVPLDIVMYASPI